MRVGVGSGNPVKVEATRRALTSEADEFGADATVEACSVPSGVPEQPSGREETRRGAANRAEAVLAEGYDLGVGIEGGVADGGDGHLVLVMWAVVTDGDLRGRGAGPSLTLPDGIADRVRAGEELGPVMDDTLGEDDVARRQGAAGALTAGRVDRTDALRTAVAGALGPFVSSLY
ncbi:inosine/xanthosine triphosphatase [Halorarum halophilum]|uniref:Probable inosine/xanthosine triphosphatase n=1 Tax=Halorarum halophilum TaxID=2743090 RepID=A0A7D5GA73_9EURY|nr:inosine/xanthosine triphosphatase [Halobaculum halophilum]QLG26225.1 inosine/xanthosine triphosphatase [Halobaculum halophilum]